MQGPRRMQRDIVAGLDVSGDQKAGNYKYMALVMGTDEKIKAIARHIGKKSSHMRDAKSKTVKERILSKVKFDGVESIAFCMYMDKRSILSPIIQKTDSNNRMAHNRIYRRYNLIAMHHMRSRIDAFLASHNHSVHDVIFECDDDCRGFVKDNGLRHCDPGNAHSLADNTAWANNHGGEPYGTIPVNLAREIRKGMRQ